MSANCPEVKFPEHRLYLPEKSNALPNTGADPVVAAAYAAASALCVQAGGDHYKKLTIQPIEYIHANGIPFAEGSVIKYVTRWRDKGGIEDLKKARHFLDLLIELEAKAAQEKAK